MVSRRGVLALLGSVVLGKAVGDVSRAVSLTVGNLGGAAPNSLTVARTELIGVTDQATTVKISDRLALVAGAYQPDKNTSGVYPGIARAAQNSAVTYGAVNTAAAPQQIPNLDFCEKVTASGQYLDFLNCFFRSTPGSVPTAAVNCTSGCKKVRFFDCTFEQQNPIWDSPGAKGWQCEFYRCRFVGTTDGFQHIGTGSDYTGVDQAITVQQCSFDDMAFMSPDPGAAGGLTDNSSHLDCVQLRGGKNILIWGNSMMSFLNPRIGGGGYLPVTLPSGTKVFGNKYATPTFDAHQGTSCIMMSPNLGTYDNLVIKQNWMDGAAYMINVNPTTTLSGVVQIIGNRVGYDSRTGNTNFLIAPTSLKPQVQFSGNVRPDTGAAADFWKAG